MKKILLFGGSGLVGSRIYKLSPKHFTVIAPTRDLIDVTRVDQIQESIRSLRPDSIIYAAAVSNPETAELEKDRAMQLNATSPAMIAEEAAKYHIPLLYLSTDAVFLGAQNHRPYREDDPLDPVNFYGFTKQKGEESVLSMSPKNCVLRLITVYSHFYPRKLDIARMAVQSFRAGKSFIGIVDQYFNPTYVDDVSAAVFGIIEKEIRGVLNFGAADYMSNYEFIKTIARVCGFSDAEVKEVTLMEFYKAHRAKRGHFVWLDTKKARKLLGKGVVSSIENGIDRFWRNFPS